MCTKQTQAESAQSTISSSNYLYFTSNVSHLQCDHVRMDTQEVENILKTGVDPDKEKDEVSLPLVTHFKGWGQR